MFPVLLAAATPSPAWTQPVLAMIVFSALFQHRQSLKDPLVNRKAVYGLVCIEFAFLVSLAYSRLGPALSSVPLKLMIGLFIFSLLLIGLLLAVLGWREIRAEKSRPLKGRAQVAWALGTGAVFLVLIGIGAVQGWHLAQERLSRQFETTQAAVDELYTNDTHHFTFRQPGPPWKKVDFKKLLPDALISFARADDMVFFISAGTVPSDATPDVEEYAEFLLANMKVRSEQMTVVAQEPHTVNGLSGLRLTVRTRQQRHEPLFIHWLHVGQGGVYQLTLWGLASQEAEVKAEAEQLFARFQLLPAPAPVAPTLPPLVHESAEYGYRVKLQGRPWKRLAESLDPERLADFDAGGGDVRLSVVPVWLAGGTPSPEALDASLLRTMSIDVDDEALSEARPVSVGTLTGREWSYTRTQDETRLSYRLRVVQAQDFAWLLVARWDGGQEELASVGEEALNSVTFTPPAGAPPSAAAGKAAASRHGQVFNALGLYAYEKSEYEPAAAWFQRSFELQPANPVALNNAVGALHEAGQDARGLELLEAHAARFPGDLELEAYRALALCGAGRLDEGLRLYASLFPARLTDELHLSHYVEVLEAHGRAAQALQVLQKYRARADSVDVTLLHANVLRHQRKYPQAAALLTRELKESLEFSLAEALVETWLEAGKPKLALKALQSLERPLEPQTPVPLLRLHARAELALGRPGEAKKTLERAQALAPGDAEVRRLLERVSGTLGEGNNSDLKKPIPEVVLPAALLAPRGKTPSAEHGAYYLHRATALAFTSGRELRTTELRQVKVLDASGVERFSTFEFELDPLSEEIFVNRLWVKEASGRVVSRGAPSDYYVSDQASAERGTQRRTLVIPVAGLKPGHVIELAVTRRALHPPDTLPFREHLFAARIPIQRATLFVTGDVGRVSWRVSSLGSPRREARSLTFAVEDLAPWHAEPLAQDFRSHLPTAWLAGSDGGWEAEVAGYQQELAPLLAPSAAIKALALQQTAGLQAESARVSVLARWVQKNLTYRALLFGRRGRIPHSGDEIVRNRYGDCKDHALLLQQLLGAVGIPSQLALVRSEGPVVAELPSLDQFDHMILHVPLSGTGLFIDATDKAAALVTDQPAWLAGQRALVLEAKPRLVSIPAQQPGHIGIERQLQVSGADVQVKERVTLQGQPAGTLREFLGGLEPSARREAFERWLGQRQGLTLSTFSAEALDDPSRPLTLALEYTQRQRFHPLEGGAVGELPMPWERIYLNHWPLEKRETPFELVHALRLRSTTRLKAPEGQEISGVEDKAGAGPVGEVDWSLTARRAAGELTLEFQLQHGAGQFPAERYAAHTGVLREAEDAMEQRVVLRPPRVALPRP